MIWSQLPLETAIASFTGAEPPPLCSLSLSSELNPMNPSSSSSSSSPYSNPSFPFLPPNPFYSQPQNPPPPPPPPPLADLSTTLSSLKSLIHVSHQTLHSLSTLLPLKPHNPNHIPCKSPQHHPFYRPSPHPLPGSDQLCFSLDGPASNSFYDEYPGVVRFPNPHAAKKTLTIPGFLSVECATGEIEGLGEQCLFRILPSELLAIRGECEAWSDYPSACSCIVLRALSSGTRMVRERDLMNWVFARSPRYGVVIDVAMADHIFSLFTLCLKAIVREALSLDGDQNKGCPVLVHSLIWFASQLSILYGETNGKLFAIDMLKQCISEAAARGLMMIESPTLKEEGSHSQNELNLTVTGKVISVSQIVAAVAALHDRALFEEKTKGFRVSQPLTRAEHDYVSQKADEERKRRPNYRPIIEHDGLPRQRSSYQEANRTKTREELLAEERDYKRRRMSYRGKKGKRTTLQVTRDIIEEYMAEIKKAGGIGCFVQGTEDGGMLLSESLSAHDITTSVDEPIGSSYAGNKGSQYNNRTQSHSDYIKRYNSFKDASPKDYEQPRRSLHEHHVNEDQRIVSHSKHDRDSYSRSPERYKSRGRSYVRSSHLLEQDDLEVTKIQHPSSGMSRYDNSRSSSSVSNSVNDISVRKDEQKSKVEHRRRRNRYENVSSDFLGQNAFEDRYNPSESLDTYEDDLSTSVKHVRQDKLFLREFHDQPSRYSAGRQYPD